MRSILRALRDRGIRVSADNFGIGHLGFDSMEMLPFDALKIDRSFVHRVTGNDVDPSRMRAVLDVAQTFNVRIIAEGVESSEDLAFLWVHGCDEALGYYFAPPVAAEQLNEMFRSQELLGEGNPFSTAVN
jgi:EAL domain-containing protein (putative c-di-GMP-specific phosphodiesterase class I)